MSAEAFDRLEEELRTVPEGDVVRLYVTRDPKGPKKASLPPIELRRDQPIADQAWQHIEANASEGGPFELRLRAGGQHIASVQVHFEFKPRPVGPAAPPPTAEDALEKLLAAEAQVRALKERLGVASGESEDDDEDGDDEEDDDELEEDEDEDELDDEDDEEDDDEREPNPAPAPSVLSTVLGRYFEGEAGQMVMGGAVASAQEWIQADAKKKTAEATLLEAQAELMRAQAAALRNGVPHALPTQDSVNGKRVARVISIAGGGERAS